MQPQEMDIEAYIAKSGAPIAIFDIGTKSSRLLLAPRQVPPKWELKTFLNASHTTNLGLGIDRATETLDSNTVFFNETLWFIRKYVNILRKCDVREVSVIGTAVFRWMQNEAEVLSLIRDKIGMDLQIISQELEGRLTLLSIPEIRRRRGGMPDFGGEDRLLMIDQGGGSLEVSWLKCADAETPFPLIRKQEADNLGTIALRQEFFTRNAENKIVPPEKNRMPIGNQVERIGRTSDAIIEGWFGMPKTSRSGTSKLFAFAVGSGVTNIWPKKGSHKVHGRTVTIDLIDKTIAERCASFGQSNQQVLSVYKALMGIEGSGVGTWTDARALDIELGLLYGLPVYRSVLKACGIDSLTVNGYGLRYGYYLDRYQRLAFDPDSSGPFVFVSYSHINPHYVYEDMYRLHSRGYRVWFDRGIRPSSDWKATLAEKISSCSALIAFLSPDSILSEHVYDEVFLAREFKKPIIPVLVGLDSQHIPPKFKMCIGAAQHLKKRADQDFLADLFSAIPGLVPESFAKVSRSGRRAPRFAVGLLGLTRATLP